jgi:hypothetical protein
MDNIRFHHSKETVEVAKQNNFNLLHILPYSPRLNAIENVFGVLKPLYKKSCPKNFNKGFNYKNCFIEIVKRYQTHDSIFLKFFNKVSHIVNDTLSSITTYKENFHFCGYDDCKKKHLRPKNMYHVINKDIAHAQSEKET